MALVVTGASNQENTRHAGVAQLHDAALQGHDVPHAAVLRAGRDPRVGERRAGRFRDLLMHAL